MSATGPTTSLAAVLAESARRRPESPALLYRGDTITYGELWPQTRAVAGALKTLGVAAGTPVAMMFPNVPDFARVYYAILSLGAIVVPVHPLLKASEIEHVLITSGSSLLIADESCATEARLAAEKTGGRAVISGDADESSLGTLANAAIPIESYLPMNPLDPAAMLFTSGTSGSSKGAVLSHFGILEQTNVALIDTLDVRVDDVFAAALPLSHVFGQSSVLNTAFRRGAAVALLGRFSPIDTLAELVETGCTIFAGVPTMYIGLLEGAAHGGALPSLRYGISGGSSLPEAVIESFAKTFGCEIYEGYGLSETSPTATMNYVSDTPRVGTVGTALWGVDVRVAVPDSEPLTFAGVDEIGEVVIRGHGLFLGYHGNEAATAATYTDGWFRTGDLGRLGDDDRLSIVDRTKDLIIRGGYNVYPREIEEVLSRMPGIRSVAVFGVNDERLGQEVVAAVIAEEGVTAEAVLDYATERIAPHKRPRRAILTDAFPLGPSGKVLKRELSQQWSS